MHIDDDIRKLLLDPTLDGSLSVSVDEFVLNTSEGPVSLSATLGLPADGRGYRIEVRDCEGRDLAGFFTRKTRLSREDSLSATGTLGNRLRVEFHGIWPPTTSTTRPIGAVKSSSAVLTFERIILPPTAFDSQTHDEIRESLNCINPHRPPILPQIDPTGPEFTHIAIFQNTKLQFFNRGTEWTECHPFWGKRSGTSGSTWDGEALGGEFSLKQTGAHLEVGFRHKGGDDAEARKRFDALLQSVAYTHAIFPWPSFIQRRCEWRVMEQSMKVVSQEQGGMFPLRDRDGYLSPEAPTDLIAAVACLFHELPEDQSEILRDTMWVFRGADSKAAPAPLEMAMVCSVIEGLRSWICGKQEASTTFTEVRDDALGLIGALEEEADSDEKAEMVRRLKGWINSWPYQDRRVEWNAAFTSLFPGRKPWVEKRFKLFQKHRHGPAHGNYGSITRGDGLATLDALGDLAGFVNLIVAAKAGYKGPILESPYADRRVELG